MKNMCDENGAVHEHLCDIGYLFAKKLDELQKLCYAYGLSYKVDITHARII
jgi:hypothetical protein